MTWRPTRMEVHLGNIKENYKAIQKHIGQGKRIFGVVKGNAYNLGAVQVAKTLLDVGADFFAVATPDEAIELREAGIGIPILVLGPSPYAVAEEYVRYGIRAAINDLGIAKALSNASQKLKMPAYGHVKIDSGMGRIGFFPEEAVDVATKIKEMSGVVMEGVFTHFAISDQKDLTYTWEQYHKFERTLKEIESAGINFRIRHCCNSGATLALPELALDGVRPGQIVVGMYPSTEVVRSVEIKPGFEFKTAVVALRDVPAGRGLSYGLIYCTSSTEKIAVLPVGYADGFNRDLSGKGTEVLVRGVRCPVVGRVCMDQTMVNVSHLPNVEIGDEVVLLGKQGNDLISLEEMAEKMGGIVTTIPTAISKRVPRVYIE